MFDPSLISDNGVEFYEVLDRDNGFYPAVYSFFNKGFADSMEFRILVVGVYKDVCINQFCGQGIPRKVYSGQMPVSRYDRDERSELSEAGFSCLTLAALFFYFSKIRQSLLSRQVFRGVTLSEYLLFFSVFRLGQALFSPWLFFCKITKLKGVSQLDMAGNLLAEADGSNNITRYYIHGLGLMAMVTPSDEVYCYHFNATGSTVAMTDSSQTIAPGRDVGTLVRK